MGASSVSTNENGDRIMRGNLRQQVTSRILAGIFQGRFASDEHLVAQRLCETFQVSQTPVREALLELANLGIVDLLPNRGAVVRPFGRQQVREISQVRRLLEVEAVRCACGRIDLAELARLERQLNALQRRSPSADWDREGRTLDTELHDLIAAASGSVRLTAEIRRYLTLIRSLRDISHQRDAGTNYSRSADMPEHLAIVAALQAGAPDRAAEAMDQHIRSASAILEAVVFGPDDETSQPIH